LKIKSGLAGIPAVKIGDNIFAGENVVGIASELHEFLTANKYISAEQKLYHLATVAKVLQKQR